MGPRLVVRYPLDDKGPKRTAWAEEAEEVSLTEALGEIIEQVEALRHVGESRISGHVSQRLWKCAPHRSRSAFHAIAATKRSSSGRQSPHPLFSASPMFIFKMKNLRACQSAPTCSHISPREHTLRLTSKTSPEAGTVSYTYNTDGTVATVTDAKSQQKTFTYDSYGRVTKIKAPGQSISYSYGSSYDGTNTLGRVATINYSVGSHTVQEGYNYTQAGDIAAKGVALDGYIPLNEGSLIATYLYDGEGHLTSVAYPVANTTTWGAPAAIYNYGLDSMGRLNTMTDQNNNTLVSGVTYSPANQILSLATSTFTETSTYNANLQLQTLVSGSYSYQYNYVAGQNNGRLYSIVDNSSGETIKYLYDSLNRLIQASGLYDPHGSWSQQFTYDGFGNLTQKIGTNAPNNLTINVDPTTNRLTGNGAVYDANGNLTQYTNTLANITFTYDSLNRLATATGWNGGSGNTANYGYDASNQRVYSNITAGGVTTETFFFYGADGKKLGVWTIPSLSSTFTLVSLNTWFGGRLLKPQDRLNSIGKYFPYGEDRVNPTPANPPNGQEKFATYTRDAETGLDYAYQRYYTAGLGRFMTPDPLDASATPTAPQSWNRYDYTHGDPINHLDPTGAYPCGGDFASDGSGTFSVTVNDCSSDAGGGGGAGRGINFAWVWMNIADVRGETILSQQTKAVRSTVIRLRGALSSDSDCLGWLMSGIAGDDLASFNKLFNALIGVGGQSPLAGAVNFAQVGLDPLVGDTGNGYTGTDIGTGFAININTSGAFFTNTVGVGYATNPMIKSIQPASPRAQMFIVLHEVAHYFQAPGFIQADNTTGRQTFNNDLLGQKCSKTIASAPNGGTVSM